MELTAVTIDCSDAERLADFYAKLTGGEVTYRDAESGHAQTTVGSGTLNFQQVHSYTPPQWPGQAHPSSSTSTSVWTTSSRPSRTPRAWARHRRSSSPPLISTE